MIDKKRTACFTGHRKIPYNDIGKIKYSLDTVIEELYKKGVIFYGVGGAYGFDTLAEEAIIKARKKHHDIKLIMVLPCEEQDKYWPEKDRRKYADILRQADKVVFLSKKYYKGCMYNRNRYLVDFSGYCVAYLTADGGGTAYTVNYARQCGTEIIFIDKYFRKPMIIFGGLIYNLIRKYIW